MSNAIENLLADFADLEPFARQFNRHPRTVRRWMDEPDGLPFTRDRESRSDPHPYGLRVDYVGRMRRPNPQGIGVGDRRRCDPVETNKQATVGMARVRAKPAGLLPSPGASSYPCTQQRSSSQE